MAIQKQPISINFAQGLDTKTDPYQVDIGKFLTLVNSVFTTTGRLTKRNGFKNISSLPNTDEITLTTLNDNLIATGSNLYAYSTTTNQWLNQGTCQPVQLGTTSMVRSSTAQTSTDAVITPDGLACVVYMDSGQSYYQISDSVTGQQIKHRTLIPTTAVNPRAFILGPYFIITFVSDILGTPTLQYIAVPTANPVVAGVPTNISANINGFQGGYDAYSVNGQLFIAWGRSVSGINLAYLTPSLALSSVTTIAGPTAKLVSVTPDLTTGRFWVSYWDDVSNNAYAASFNFALVNLLAPTQFVTTTVLAELTSIATDGVLHLFYQTVNSYSYTAARTDFVSAAIITNAGIVSATTIIKRSVGLASKAFIDQTTGIIYMFVAYGDVAQATALRTNQPTYFLIDSIGNIYMNMAYSNGGGYEATQVLPNVTYVDNSFYVPYLITDFITTTNKMTDPPPGTPANAIFTNTGVNLAKFSLAIQGQHSSEIAGALHLTGGQLWEYDGVKPVEHGFHVWPENVIITTSTTGGLITAGTYFYVFTYEWTDNAGNLHRSAPSIPVKVVTTGATSSNTINVPTLRLTAKASPNPVRIVGYRYSAAQPVYYQFTSITNPIINDTTVDSITGLDTLPDSAILGNAILYTTGGVVENTAAPASIASALFSNRLFLIDAEDQNVLWFSKQVIQNVPVEMSDLLTLYIAPTTGAQGSTGPMTALSAMDDKLIIFKKDAIYYVNGSGPDNTGANSTFSDPIFITATVGCANPNSIVLIPSGIMFQSDKGIWLLGRDLQTAYIGAPVETYNNQVVMSATAIPGTNQVRLILDNNITLVFDYFFNQWSTHTNVNAISATLHQGLHTYLNSYGMVFQETPNLYKDGSIPVLMNLTTSWINVASVQGYERFYFAYLLGTYLSPFKLNVTLAYDYNPSASQAIIVTPDLFSPAWGGEANWGSGGPWGGPGNVFEARLFPQQQKCESFQVSIQEVYDLLLGANPGAGLTLSGMNLIVGMKKGYRTQSAKKSYG